MKHLFLILYIFFSVGCASVGTYQTWKTEVLDEEGIVENKAKWVNKERYICRAVGCKVDFKNQTMEGGK
ncbi:MAG: hypothetical protein ACUZ8H_06750, partial [Candidatus Anammoxibacter sp.]